MRQSDVSEASQQGAELLRAPIVVNLANVLRRRQIFPNSGGFLLWAIFMQAQVDAATGNSYESGSDSLTEVRKSCYFPLLNSTVV